MNTQEIGKVLKDARKTMSMTQQEVADKIGMTQTNYAKYERGEIGRMTTVTLGRLATIFNISRDTIGDIVMQLSKQEDSKKITLHELQNNPPKRYAADSSVKTDDSDAEYLWKKLEAIKREEESGNW